jgi:hypothetical protein
MLNFYRIVDKRNRRYAMNRSLSAVATIVIVIGNLFGQVAQRSRPLPIKASTRLQLTATADPPSVRPGETLTLKLLVKNVTQKTMTVVDNGVYNDYELVVTDASGKEPPKTEFGRSLAEEATAVRSTTRDIEPGEVIQAALEITRIYDLKMPGVYYVRADREVWDDTPVQNRTFLAKAFSNPVEFRILP